MKYLGKAALLFALFSLALYGSFTYSYVPKKLYANQVFPVTVMERNASKPLPRMRFRTEPGHAYLLSQTPLLIRNGSERFFTFYFKASDDDITLPTLDIFTAYDHLELPPQDIEVYPLQSPDDFCRVLATDMTVRYAQVSHYDETRYLVTLSIEAYEANVEDMRLDAYPEYGLENLKRHNAKVTAEFYVVVPETLRELTFSYYNTVKERFVSVHIPIEINDATVVTQTDLNPKEDKFELLKKYTLIGLSLFFFVMFMLSRDLFYVALGVVSLLMLGNFYMPRKHVCVKEGSPLYILPTQNSNISTRIDRELHTPLLNTRGIYNKIELKPGIVGWVKNEDLCEN